MQDADVIIVGARVAGAALAIRLARCGRRVMLVDRVRFPKDTMSTHCWGPEISARFHDLGTLTAIVDAGMEPIHGLAMLYDDLSVQARLWPSSGIDHGGSLRRVHLDAALVAAARSTAGVEVVEGSRVDVVSEGEKAVGVRGSGVEFVRLLWSEPMACGPP